VAVVNVFGGIPDGHRDDAWWDRLTGAGDSAARQHERPAEHREALAAAGREPIDLGFLDGQYRDGPPDLGEIAAAIDQAAGTEAALYAPAALDGHRDHRAVRAVALQLRGRGRDVLLYAAVPHSTEYGWPAWVTGEQPHELLRPEASWDHHLAGAGLRLDDLRAEVHELDERERGRKLAAARLYRTQFPAIEALWGVSRPEVLRYEIVWRMDPP
jgi:hypothetical protein